MIEFLLLLILISLKIASKISSDLPQFVTTPISDLEDEMLQSMTRLGVDLGNNDK